MDNSVKTARFGAFVFGAVGLLLVEIATASPMTLYPRQHIVDHALKEILPVADNLQSASKEEAEAFLAKAIPLATIANPKYRGENGALTQWLTKDVTFAPGTNPNGVLVRMSEEVLNFKNGVRISTGTHEVQFQIEDVAISLLTDSPDLTESGEQGQGVIFKCASGKCVMHKWDGVGSSADATDISIQDLATRDKILAAFLALKHATGG
jgi:hypothetical protein